MAQKPTKAGRHIPFQCVMLGMARRLRRDLHRPVVCMLQGEDYFWTAFHPLSETRAGRPWRPALPMPISSLHPAATSRNSCNAGLACTLPGLGWFTTESAWRATRFKNAPASSAARFWVISHECVKKRVWIFWSMLYYTRQRRRIAGLSLCVAGSLGPMDEPFVESLRNGFKTLN